MLHITNLEDGLELFKALGSDVRVRILEILLEYNNMNMNDLASRLEITNGALTSHIKKLEECGLIKITNQSTGHGNQKIASLNQDKILIELTQSTPERNVYKTSIPIGNYSTCSVYPTCGLATEKHLIGDVDDRRYFFHNDRYKAQILWFTKGYVEYIIPNFIPGGQKIDEICITMEISSEAPGVNENWPSDIYFYLNDINVAMWTSPGDFGDVRGILTPDWWIPKWNQYGLLKMLQINKKGSFVDGVKKSDITIEQFELTDKSMLRFRIAVPESAEHVGGVTLFGRAFGNYSQDIDVYISYSPRRMDTTATPIGMPRPGDVQ
jgi:predicted transcriptional regulator